MKATKGGFILKSSGRYIKMYGSDGFTPHEHRIRYGYDGHVDVFDDEDDIEPKDLTQSEMLEIAMYSIEEWMKFINNLLPKTNNDE